MNGLPPGVVIIADDLAYGSDSEKRSGAGMAMFRGGAALPGSPQPGTWQITVSTVRAPGTDRDGNPVPRPARTGTIVGPVFGMVDGYREAARLVVKEERLTVAGGRPEAGSSRTAQDLAGLHHVFEYGLYRRGVPYLDVPATAIKKYATGRHNAAKEDVRVAAAKRLEHLAECSNNNESDALWLLVMTLAHYGLTLVQLPVAQQIAVDKIAWPAVPGLDLKGYVP